MILSMGSQVKLFLLTILLGVITGFIYDLIKTLRKILKHNNFMIQVEDFLFWIWKVHFLRREKREAYGFCIFDISYPCSRIMVFIALSVFFLLLKVSKILISSIDAIIASTIAPRAGAVINTVSIPTNDINTKANTGRYGNIIGYAIAMNSILKIILSLLDNSSRFPCRFNTFQYLTASYLSYITKRDEMTTVSMKGIITLEN